MNNLIAGIQILRPLNILLTLLSVFIASWLINSLESPLLFYTGLVVICFAGASNILNDVLDIRIDKINRPNRVLSSEKLQIKDAVILMSVLYSTGIIASTYINPLGRYIALALVLPLLILYTPFLKKMPLIGNLVVGLILGLVFIFTEGAIIGNVDKMWIPFALSAHLSSIRELIKDAADIKGDSIINLQTFPIKYGLKSTLWLLRILTSCLCFFAIIPYLKGWYGNYYIILLFFSVLLPSIYSVFFLLNKTSIEQDYHRIAKIFKAITIAGMLVILSTGF